jgi:hypothetical protein
VLVNARPARDEWGTAPRSFAETYLAVKVVRHGGVGDELELGLVTEAEVEPKAETESVANAKVRRGVRVEVGAKDILPSLY